MVTAFWVIFINLTGSFSVGFLRVGSAVSRPQERHRYTLLPLLPDLFYGVQGKFLKIFGGPENY